MCSFFFPYTDQLGIKAPNLGILIFIATKKEPHHCCLTSIEVVMKCINCRVPNAKWAKST